MKKNLSDEKLEKMLVNMFDPEIPEDLQFSDEKRAEEIHISVKKEEKRYGIKTAGVLAACAALMIAFPAVWRLSGIGNDSMDDSVLVLKQSATEMFPEYLGEFEKEISENRYICEELKDSNYYKEYFDHPFSSEPVSEMTGVFYALGLIPENTENAYLYVRTVQTPDGIDVITRQAYIVWYGDDSEVTAVMKTNEKLSDEEISVITKGNIFRGAKNSDSGIKSLESRFISRKSEVSYEGTIIRPDVPDRSIADRIKLDGFRAYFSSGGSKKPVCLYDLRYQYDSELFRDSELIPDTGMNIVCENGKTDYHAVIGYDSTQNVSLKLKDFSTDGLWGGKEIK